MFLGYDMTSTGFGVLILSTLKVVVSDEVKFQEDDLEGLTSSEPQPCQRYHIFRYVDVHTLNQHVLKQNTELGEDNLDNVATPLERRYPLRNRKPKIIQSMTSMDFYS